MPPTFPISLPNYVIQETFDDNEVVVVNLNSGAYYSITGLAADLWVAIDNGGNREDLLEHLGGAGGETQLDLFLELLGREGLLGDEGGAFLPASAGELLRVLQSTPFDGMFEKHTDVEDLLLIDPIHEVDAAGWPNSA